jgi:hypothetical protein
LKDSCDPCNDEFYRVCDEMICERIVENALQEQLQIQGDIRVAWGTWLRTQFFMERNNLWNKHVAGRKFSTTSNG